MGWKPAPRWDRTNRVWRVCVRGKRYSLGHGDETDAHVAWAKLRRELGLADEVLESNAAPTVAEAIEAWLKVNPGKWHLEMLTPWHRFAGAELVATLDAEHLDRYLKELIKNGYTRRRKKGVQKDGTPIYVDEKRKYAAQTLRHMVSHAHRVLVWCQAKPRRWIDDVPQRPAMPKSKKGHRGYKDAQLRAMAPQLNAAQDRIVRFILETGCRP